MNMISTGTFLNGMDASNKQSELVKKLVAAWEKKNSKAARAGGVSLMALSLAACGGEDTTPFAQSDIDAATAPLTAAVAAAETALTAAQADAAAALVAQSAAETQAAEALVAAAGAQADAAAATVAGAAATAAAAAATVAQAAAEASLATAEAALATANAEKATLQTSYDALVASNTTLQTSYDALVAPRAEILEAAVNDALQGASGDDVFTGAAGTLAAGDSIRDPYTNDNDTLTITDTDGTLGQFTVQNIENVNMNINSLTANVDVDATNFIGVTNLTVTRGDLTVGGATLTGSNQVDVIALDASDVAKVTVAGKAGVVNVTQATKSGVVIDADIATGNVTVIGSATVNSAGMGTGDTLTITAMTAAQAGSAALAAVENAKAVTLNTGAATVTVANSADPTSFTGAITVTGAATGVVTIPAAAGGATVTALGATTDGVDIRGIDASGATVTTTLSAISTAPQVIDLGAVNTAAVTATASVSAVGSVALETGVATDAIDSLTLSGNGGAVTYTIVSTNGATETITATSDVTVAGDEAEFSGNTVTGAAAINLASTSTAGAIAASLWSATEIGVAFDNANNAITAASGQNYEITANQSGLDFDFGATVVDQDVTITAGDVNGTSTAVGTLTLGAVNATSGTPTSGTLSIIANESNLTATTITLDADQDIVVTGDEDVNLGTVATANAINSQGSTGNTTVTLGAAAKSVSSGSGTDTITLSGNRIHTVDAGAGGDTITVTSTAATSTIDAGAGNDAVTLTDVDQYVVIGGTGTDNFNVGVASGATIIGGDGTDTLTMTAGGVTLAAGFLTSSVENLNLNATNGTTAFTSTQFAGLTGAQITGNSTTDVLQVTAVATGATMDYTGLTESTGSTQVVNYVLGAGADTVTGSSAFGETFVMNDLKGVDVIAGAAGTGNTDTITSNDTTYKEVATSNATTGIVVNLGDAAVTSVSILAEVGDYLAAGVSSVAGGTITQIYDAADSTSVNSNVVDTVSGIENFTSTDAAGVEYVVGTSGNNVISVGAGVDYVNGGAGNDTITGGAGADKLHGGDGDDTIVLTDTTMDTITGGLGSADALAMGGGLTIGTGQDFANASGLEKLIASEATTNAISFTAHADFITDTGITTFDFSADTNATGTNVIDLSNLSTTTATTVTGSAGVDQITLDAGDISSVKGGNGVDAIDFSGGTTADTIDVTGAHAANDHYDTVANMVVTHDKIKLDASATTIGTASGVAAVVEDEATAAANVNGAAYSLAAALTANTNSLDLVTLDTAVLANKANANLDAAGTINNGTELLKCLVAAGVGSTASGITVDNAGDEFYILTDDGTDSYLYYANSGADTTLSAAEIQLVFDAAGVQLDGMSAANITIA